jgi:hypothetical protein
MLGLFGMKSSLSLGPCAAVALGVATFACAGVRPAPADAPTTTFASLEANPPSGSAGATCVLDCAAARVDLSTSVDHHEAASSNADAVFAEMHGDLLACYRARAVRDPRAHASITVDVVVNPDGSVRSVATTGGAMLGDAGLACITRRVKRATFAPVWGGGTLHLQVPMSFRRIGPDETT